MCAPLMVFRENIVNKMFYCEAQAGQFIFK